MRKKILMIIEGVVPPVGGGGAENQVITLCEQFQSTYGCLIITPMVTFGKQIKHDNFKNIDILRIPYPKIFFIGKIILLYKLFIYFIKERHNYDIIHSHIAGSMSAVSSLAGYILGKLVIVKITGWTEADKGILSDKHKYNIFNIIKRNCIKLASYTQAISHSIGNDLIRFGFSKEQILYLPNAVNTDKYNSDFSKEMFRNNLSIDNLSAGDYLGLYVGRLEVEKGIYDFLKIWCQRNHENLNFKLIIIGSGTLEDKINQLIIDNNLVDNVVLLGAKSNIQDFTLACDFGVLPSSHEGLSNTLLEYMSSSLPVIGTRVSGTEDFIHTGSNGWIYDYGNNADLNSIITELYSFSKNELNEYGQESRKNIIDKASIPVVINKLNAIYQES